MLNEDLRNIYAKIKEADMQHQEILRHKTFVNMAIVQLENGAEKDLILNLLKQTQIGILRMIQKGQLTVIDMETYTCIDVKDGYAYLKNVLHEQGRPKKKFNILFHTLQKMVSL